MKFIYLMLFLSGSLHPCCWKKKPIHFPKAAEQMLVTQITPIPITITNINELVIALSALQNANLAASISITPPPGEPHQVTPEPNKHDRIDVPSADQMVTLSKLKKSHDLIESFYTYPAGPGDEKINK